MLYQRGKGKVIRQKNGKERSERIWWYRFRFGGRIIHESSKSTSKEVAREAEKQRRRQLEESWNQVTKRTLPPTFERASAAWIELKRPHLAPRSVEIEEQNLVHLLPTFGRMLITDITAQDVSRY
ncbi:MAG: hypothetical protein M1423_00310 [Acidobacteria bacterium]|nr:hypothetical protein [Acidobacteriota bacterium]